MVYDVNYMEANIANYDYMQFTGVQDSEGKDVFEGDLIEVVDHLNGSETHLCKVKWGFLGYDFEICGRDRAFVVIHPHLKIKVVGNIYENSDLQNKAA